MVLDMFVILCMWYCRYLLSNTSSAYTEISIQSFLDLVVLLSPAYPLKHGYDEVTFKERIRKIKNALDSLNASRIILASIALCRTATFSE